MLFSHLKGLNQENSPQVINSKKWGAPKMLIPLTNMQEKKEVIII